MGLSRRGHLAWCKKRALQYIENGDVKNAFASMAIDLKKHTELSNHPFIALGLIELLSGRLTSPEEMRKFIKGFN